MKQSVRQFLKPDWRKILITLILLGLTYFCKVNCSPGGLVICEAYGFPISYFRMWSGDFAYRPQYSILWLGLVVDLIFWYFVSSAIVFALIQSKKRR
jgi:hypothetical protein